MPRARTSWGVWVFVVVGLAGTARSEPVEESPPEKPKPLFDRLLSAEIETAMARQVNWSFDALPLLDVVDFIAADLKIAVRIAAEEPSMPTAVRQAKLTPKQRTVEAALDEMLQPLGLSWYLTSEGVVIDLPDNVARKYFARGYVVDREVPWFNGQWVAANIADNFEKSLRDRFGVDPFRDGTYGELGLFYSGEHLILAVNAERSTHLDLVKHLTRLDDDYKTEVAPTVYLRTADSRGKPVAKPYHGQMFTGLDDGQHARVRYVTSGCFHSAEFFFTFSGRRPGEVDVSQVVTDDDGAEKVVALGTVKLSREDRRRLNHSLNLYRTWTGGGCTTTTSVEIQWFADGVKQVEEILFSSSCDEDPDALGFYELIQRLPTAGEIEQRLTEKWPTLAPRLVSTAATTSQRD